MINGKIRFERIFLDSREEQEMVKINGEWADVVGERLSDYLDSAGYDLKRIVVERNEEIVPKTQYAQTVFAEEDVIEVISFMGGG